MCDKIIITIAMHGKTRSAELSDESTWSEVLDEVLALLQMPDGYSITGSRLIDWATETEMVKED